jgi:hypothetical protein
LDYNAKTLHGFESTGSICPASSRALGGKGWDDDHPIGPAPDSATLLYRAKSPGLP